MDGGHQAFLDAETFFEKNVHDRGEAIGGAARIGDDVVLRRVVEIVIHTLNEGAVLTGGGSGDDDLFRTGGDVAACLISSGEKSGGLDHDFNTELFPWQAFGSAGGDDLDLVAVDHDDIVFLKLRGRFLRGNLTGELALRGVVFQ